MIQLLHKPLLRYKPSVSVCWVWRGHLDPIHVRNVMGRLFQCVDRHWFCGLTCDWTEGRGGPIGDRCVSSAWPIQLLCCMGTHVEKTVFFHDLISKVCSFVIRLILDLFRRKKIMGEILHCTKAQSNNTQYVPSEQAS